MSSSDFDTQGADPQATEDDGASQIDASRPAEAKEEDGRGGHSRWLMIACCVPMLAIAVALVAAGAGIGFLALAVLCTAMMVAMMVGMSGGGGGGS